MNAIDISGEQCRALHDGKAVTVPVWENGFMWRELTLQKALTNRQKDFIASALTALHKAKKFTPTQDDEAKDILDLMCIQEVVTNG